MLAYTNVFLVAVIIINSDHKEEMEDYSKKTVLLEKSKPSSMLGSRKWQCRENKNKDEAETETDCDGNYIFKLLRKGWE